MSRRMCLSFSSCGSGLRWRCFSSESFRVRAGPAEGEIGVSSMTADLSSSPAVAELLSWSAMMLFQRGLAAMCDSETVRLVYSSRVFVEGRSIAMRPGEVMRRMSFCFKGDQVRRGSTTKVAAARPSAVLMEPQVLNRTALTPRQGSLQSMARIRCQHRS